MFLIKKVPCIPFNVTSYQRTVHELLEILNISGIVHNNNITLEEILRYKYKHRVINPYILKQNGESFVQDLINQALSNIYFWDFDAMCQIAIDLKLSELTSKDRYVSLIPTFNGKAGMAVCTITKENETVELGLHKPDVCQVINGTTNEILNSDVIMFS